MRRVHRDRLDAARDPANGDIDLMPRCSGIVRAEGTKIRIARVEHTRVAWRDRELLDVVARCEGETAIQLKWLRTRMKQAAPQALVVAR